MNHEENNSQPRTKLQRLEMLRNTLLDLRTECFKDQKEWLFYNKLSVQVYDELTEERRKLGYMAVYPIVNGSASESIFEGTPEQCRIFVDIWKQSEHNTEVIVLQL